MADNNAVNSAIHIEGNVASWDCVLQGNIHGTYIGTFKFRCFLTPTQKIACGRNYRELLGANPTLAMKHEDDLAFSLSQLKYRIISAPPFWSSAVGLGGIQGDLPDENVINAVLEAAIDAELKYVAQLKDKREEAVERAKKAAERILQQRDEGDHGENEEGGDQS